MTHRRVIIGWVAISSNLPAVRFRGNIWEPMSSKETNFVPKLNVENHDNVCQTRTYCPDKEKQQFHAQTDQHGCEGNVEFRPDIHSQSNTTNLWNSVSNRDLIILYSHYFIFITFRGYKLNLTQTFNELHLTWTSIPLVWLKKRTHLTSMLVVGVCCCDL